MHVRNSIGWREHLARLQGSSINLDLRRYDAALGNIDSIAARLAHLSDRDIETRSRALRRQPDQALDAVRSEFFALVREASRRVLGLRPFDEQVLAAIAMDEGHVVDMQTGEGKTLAAVMPAALRALASQGAHVLTFNDYLARRDAEWMGPVYAMLGLSVGFVREGMTRGERRQAYLADVTYVTAKEAGFDHLRDLLATDRQSVVHRPFHFALVDEADSLFIDEARAPLVIAGSIDGESPAPRTRLAALVAAMTPGVHFDTDEYGRDVELTDAGVEHVERALGVGSLHVPGNYQVLTEVNCALHAHLLLRRDVDYIVRHGRIQIIDEFTGRVAIDRHWPDGLQTALEAKEGLERQPDGRILGSITMQHFLRGYPRLCGMTGTAQTAATELRGFYGLDVVVVPTHRPMIRVDHPDVIFTHREAKERAVVKEIQRAHATGRPVLVGTLTVEESERIAAQLHRAGVACEILNARNDAMEARIITGAGARHAVTISTNMAGRGTDIRLGPGSEAEHEQVVALGGLYVIGTNRHESRRVDLQLRGRAGRQGDPGESRFFVSLEDPLLVRYGVDALIAGRVVTAKSDDPLDHPVLRREIARAQRIIEGQDLEIRKTLSQYSSVLERQRRDVMELRQAILNGNEGTARLHQIDRAWRDHLALAADLREGIHLVALGGQEPLTHFTRELTFAFRRLEGEIDHATDVDPLTIKGPSSTWTYIINDDPFRNQIATMLTGPGRATIAIYAAAMMMPLLIAWGAVDRWLRRRAPRRGDR